MPATIMSKTQMLNATDIDMPNKYFTICEDDGFIYKYEKTNTVDSETGKFRKHTTGGSDIIGVAGVMMGNFANEQTIIYDNRELNDLTDVTVTSPSNGQVLKYDGTNNIWTNSNAPSGGGSNSTILTQTLTSGSTSVTFTNIPTTGNYIADFYTSNGINYTAINTATAGQVTLTFEEQSSDVTVYCELKEIS